jgi:hypothetical protein
MISNPALARPGTTIPVAIPLQEWLPWAVFAGLVFLFAVYLVGCEQGALAIFGGTNVHEWMHDSRHLLGFPCH